MTPSSNIDSNSGSNSVSKSRSSQPKNFEKVMRKERHDARPQDDQKKFLKAAEKEAETKTAFDAVYDESDTETVAKPMPTLFDLQSNQAPGEDGEEEEDIKLTLKAMPPELQKGSLSALFSKFGSREKLASMQKEVSASQKGETTVFMREQPDLAAVNPNAGASIQPISFETVKESAAQLRTNATDMQELVDQIVAKIYTLKVEGKMDTVITLKNPPIFEGANLTITTYNSAKGQFNLTFENLTQAAKNLIDMAQNQNSLRNALEQKGYMVHIVVASTTTLENKPVAEGQGLPTNEEDRRRRREEEKEE